MKLTCSLQVDSRPLQGNFLHLIEYANESRNSEKCHAALTVGLEEV